MPPSNRRHSCSSCASPEPLCYLRGWAHQPDIEHIEALWQVKIQLQKSAQQRVSLKTIILECLPDMDMFIMQGAALQSTQRTL